MCSRLCPEACTDCVQITYLNGVVLPDDDDASSDPGDGEDEEEELDKEEEEAEE